MPIIKFLYHGIPGNGCLHQRYSFQVEWTKRTAMANCFFQIKISLYIVTLHALLNKTDRHHNSNWKSSVSIDSVKVSAVFINKKSNLNRCWFLLSTALMHQVTTFTNTLLLTQKKIISFKWPDESFITFVTGSYVKRPPILY